MGEPVVLMVLHGSKLSLGGLVEAFLPSFLPSLHVFFSMLFSPLFGGEFFPRGFLSFSILQRLHCSWVPNMASLSGPISSHFILDFLVL